MIMETAISTISVLPSNKEEAQKFAGMLKNELLAKGTLKDLVQLKAIEKVFKEILTDEDLDKYFLDEFLKYDEKEKVVISGATITKSEVGVSYLYAESGDITWSTLDAQIKVLNEKKKAREAFLLNLPDEGIIGKGILIIKPPKVSKTKVKVSL
jgi:hypothetical protein